MIAEVEANRLESGGEGPPNDSLAGLKALEAISNCSIMQLAEASTRTAPHPAGNRDRFARRASRSP